MQIIANNPRSADWICSVADCAWTPDMSSVCAYADEKPVAGVVYRLNGSRDCVCSIASNGSKRWATRFFLWRIFSFAFNLCRRERVTALIAAGNQASIRLVERMGFKREGVVRAAGPRGEDLLLYGMLRSECRYITKEFRERALR